MRKSIIQNRIRSFAYSITILSIAANFIQVEPTFSQTEDSEANSTENQPDEAASSVNKDGSLDGFYEAKWEDDFKKVKQGLKDLATAKDSPDRVKILYEEVDQYIIVRRNGLLYTYRFYKPDAKLVIYKDPDKTQDHPEYTYGRFFYVSVSLPMIPASEVRDKLAKKYDQPDKSVLDELGNGVFIWRLKAGLIFQWQEKFEGKNYTRRVDYISKKIRKEIKIDNKLFFTAKEKNLLDKAEL